MQSSSNYQGQGGPVPKLLSFAYFAATVVMVILVITNLALDRWVDYCYWYFGLIHADYWGASSLLDDEDTVKDVHDNACDSHNKKSVVEYYCPDACRNIDNLKTGGEVMLAFGVLCLLSLVIAFMLHVVIILKRELKLRLIYGVDVLPSLFFVLGMILYGSTSNFNNFDDTHSHGMTGDYSPDDLEWKAGFGLAVSNCIFLPIYSAFSVFVSYKTLTR